jgi:2-methylcitrate dehydratase PrpD
VLELTGRTSPRTGLEGKFSVYHACAAGIVFGQAGEGEFSDAMVARPDLVALRQRVTASVDPAIGEDAADVTIVCRDGRELHVFVAHAIGSFERPMSDADLRRKFRGLVDPVLGKTRSEALIERCATLSACTSIGTIAALTRPDRSL